MNRRQFIRANVCIGIATHLPFHDSASNASRCDRPIRIEAPLLFDAALFVVLDRQLASIALVQRTLRLAYREAVAVFNILADTGLISRHLRADGYRQILMDDASQARFLALNTGTRWPLRYLLSQ